MTPPKPPPISPAGYQHSLKERAKAESRLTGIPFLELIELYYHRRLLARVFHADATHWVLKGGQALLARWPEVRHSTDIDLLSHEDTVDAAVEALIEAASVDLGDPYDPLTYIHTGTTCVTNVERPTRTVKFEARFGHLRTLEHVSVDVVVAAPPRGTITTEPLRSPFKSDCETWPDVQMYPIEDHVADKICAMYSRYGEDECSTRFKDLVDLALIALKTTLPGAFTHSAVHDEVKRRKAAGGRVILPDSFDAPSPAWTLGYGNLARTVRSLPPEFHTLDGVHPLGDAFITPLLQPTPPQGQWNPSDRIWR